MNQQHLFEPDPRSKIESLSREEMIQLIESQQSVLKIVHSLKKDNDRLRSLNKELEQKNFYIDEQYITIKNKLFGKSSEKQPSQKDQRDYQKKNKKKNKKKKVQLPSQRYPDLPLIEREVEATELPSCPCCTSEMEDSGLTENSEHLTKIPAQFYVVRVKRHKYRCRSCQSALVTVPAPPKIKEGGSYSDELIVDAAMSKYCDLIPMERYSKIAERAGVMDLAPNSLIQQTHYLADFTLGAYNKLEKEAKLARLLGGDETPHRMLEGDKKSNWYLWGFSSLRACFLEARDTRSGDVAIDFLKESQCRYLITDDYSGYSKAVREINKLRKAQNLPKIINLKCNAHSRRKFKESFESFPEIAQEFIDIYAKIYRLQGMLAKKKVFQIERIRRLQKKLFEEMKTKSMNQVYGYSSKSKLGKAFRYFLKNYESLVGFMDEPGLPIDNNAQERLFRSPVVGRKTWYGTHSKRGAKTNAILFSLVESCKLNEVNPREYFKELVAHLHQGGEPFTPSEFREKSFSQGP